MLETAKLQEECGDDRDADTVAVRERQWVILGKRKKNDTSKKQKQQQKNKDPVIFSGQQGQLGFRHTQADLGLHPSSPSWKYDHSQIFLTPYILEDLEGIIYVKCLTDSHLAQSSPQPIIAFIIITILLNMVKITI